MTSSQEAQSVVAVYATHAAAEDAIKAVQQAGIDMKRLSIVGKGFHTEEHALGFYSAGDRMKFWGGRGLFWGSLWGILFGNALFFVPAIGPLLVMGPLVGWMAGVLEGAAVGGAAGILAAGLASIGIPKDSVVRYELQVKAGQFLVLANGDAALVAQVRSILLATGAGQVTSHPGAAADRALPPSSAAAGTAGDQRAAQVTREAILMLLSDEEVARVSDAESMKSLPLGEEYLDLEHLDLGVRRGLLAKVAMHDLLPRRAVHEQTWSRILKRLEA